MLSLIKCIVNRLWRRLHNFVLSVSCSCSTISRGSVASWSREPDFMLLKLPVHWAICTPWTLFIGKQPCSVCCTEKVCASLYKNWKVQLSRCLELLLIFCGGSVNLCKHLHLKYSHCTFSNFYIFSSPPTGTWSQRTSCSIHRGTLSWLTLDSAKKT